MAVESRGSGRGAPDPDLSGAPGGPIAGSPAISVSGVSKTFRIPGHRYTTLKERVIQPRRRTEQWLQALRDVSFEVGRGEFFGILGPNGSGKSTLLKTVAGILQPDTGSIDTRGSISPLLALGIGFHPELAAKDNVVVNGALMGIGKKEMLRRFPGILEYAELEDFEDLPLKNYSSGMMLRLAFAAGIHVDADILLLDEILAVGDIEFQEKCFETIRRLKREGKTIVLVSHGLASIAHLCDRAMLLDHGRVIAVGDPEEVVNDYTTTAIEEIVAQEPGGEARWGDGSAEVVDVSLEDRAGRQTRRFDRGDEITVRVKARFKESMQDAYVGFRVHDHAGQLIFEVSEPARERATVTAGSEVVFTASFEGWFNPGHYAVWPLIAQVGDVTHLSELRANYARFMIEGDSSGVAPMYPRTQTAIEVV